MLDALRQPPLRPQLAPGIGDIEAFRHPTSVLAEISTGALSPNSAIDYETVVEPAAP